MLCIVEFCVVSSAVGMAALLCNLTRRQKELPAVRFQMRLLISSAPSDLNVKLLGSLIYEEYCEVR